MFDITDIQQAFRAIFGKDPACLVRACGRINLIGEHTDYNDGFVLPGAIDRYLFFAAAKNHTSTCKIHALDIQESASFEINQLEKGAKLWLNYLMGIFQQFQLSGHAMEGIDVVFGGNLPIGAGVSSSAALECGFATSLNHLFQGNFSNPEIAQLAQRSSHNFVGIPCGIMDQFASVMGRADHFILLDCRSLDYRYVPCDLKDYQIVLLDSKVHHELASSEYPVRVAECRAGIAYLQAVDPSIKSLRDASLPLLESYKNKMEDKIYRRCRYVITENERLLQACDYLQKGEIKSLGQLLYQTHAGLRDDYAVSCPELDFLVDTAAGIEGVAGARLMGGGFGGCTINLVQKQAVQNFIETMLFVYKKQFGIQSEAYLYNIVDGTRVISSNDTNLDASSQMPDAR